MLGLRKRSRASIPTPAAGGIYLTFDSDGLLVFKKEDGSVVAPETLISELATTVAGKQDASSAATDAELGTERTAREGADATLTAAAAAAKAVADAALPKAGGTLTGDIVLKGDPTANLNPATKQWVAAQIAALINGAPGALDTLKEIADQLGSDESAVTALTATVAGKLAAASNLSDLVNAVTARANLGLGSAATHPSTDFDAAGAASAEETRAKAVEATKADLEGGVLKGSQVPPSLEIGFTGDSTGATDVGPALMEAFEKSSVVRLKRGGKYLINSAVFLDSVKKAFQYVLDATGAEIVYGSGLPSASTMSGLAGTKWAFFNNTKRAALSGGVVTTSEANRSSENALPPAPRLIIKGGVHNANGNIIGIAYGNGAATHLRDGILENIQVGISWSGYVDENKAENCQIKGANPTGGSPTRIVYQTEPGDGTAATNTKAFGGVHMDLAGCHGFKADAQVSGQFILNASEGVIDAAHQETDEISTTAYSVFLNRSRLTYQGGYTFHSKKPTAATFKIEDEAGPSATFLDLINLTAAYYFRASDTDPERGPVIQIAALNPNGRVRVKGFKSVILNGVAGLGAKQAEGMYVTSSVEAIQAALTAGADLIAGGNWELAYVNGAWLVRGLAGLSVPARIISAPTLAAAADTTGIAGTLTENQEYSYVAMCFNGHYTPTSAEVKAKAGSTKTIKLTLTNPGTPSRIRLFRFKGASGAKAEPDHYVEIPMDGYEGAWYDTGTRINGLPWLATEIPVPNTAAGSGSIITPGDGLTVLTSSPQVPTTPVLGSLTAGTDTFFVSGKLFVASVWLPFDKEVTGVKLLIGSVGGTNKAVVQLNDYLGALLANSTVASEGTLVGTAAEYQLFPFTAPILLKGPANYLIGVSANGNTAKFRSIPSDIGGVAAELSQTKAEPKAIAPPGSFTVAKGPIAFLY